MEGSSSQHFQDQHKGSGFESLNFNGNQILDVSNVMNAGVLSQEVQNLAPKDSMNGKGVKPRDDCHFFVRNGWCKFGSNCRYNHPVVRRSEANKEITKPEEENLHGMGQVECKYYLKPEGCKHGKACRYNHSGRKTVAAPVLEFNFLGLPIRPGEKECPYYKQTGSCKYGMNCWFDNPPSVGGGFPFYGYNGLEDAMPCWSLPVPVPVTELAPFEPHVYQPAQYAPYSEWIGYQVPLEHHEAPIYTTSGKSPSTTLAISMNTPATGKSQSMPPAISMNTLASDVKSSPQHQQRVLAKESPKANVQPERSFMVGFGSLHPKTSSCPLNDKGLPLRPDFEVCAFYGRYGVCKHGPACKFDHPPTRCKSVPAARSEEAQLPQLPQLPNPTTEELPDPAQLPQLPNPTTEELPDPTHLPQLPQLPNPTTEELPDPAQLPQFPNPTSEELPDQFPNPTSEELPDLAAEELPHPTHEDKN